jgi:hypothetical protein
VGGGGGRKGKRTNSQTKKGGKAIKIKHKKQKWVNKKEKTNIKRQ